MIVVKSLINVARVRKLAEACANIEARAKERFEQEMAEHRAKLAARQAQVEATGKKPSGRPPAPPVRPRARRHAGAARARQIATTLRIAGSRTAVWQFYELHGVSFKKVCSRRPLRLRVPCAAQSI
jgi:hypothetical protein